MFLLFLINLAVLLVMFQASDADLGSYGAIIYELYGNDASR